MLNIICTIEQITPIFCVFLSIIVSSINPDLLIYFNTKYKWFVERKYIVFNLHTKNL